METDPHTTEALERARRWVDLLDLIDERDELLAEVERLKVQSEARGNAVRTAGEVSDRHVRKLKGQLRNQRERADRAEADNELFTEALECFKLEGDVLGIREERPDDPIEFVYMMRERLVCGLTIHKLYTALRRIEERRNG